MSVKSQPSVRSASGFPFVMQGQDQINWCWAATAVSIAVYYDSASPWLQCTLADAEFGRTTCCDDGSTAGCDRPWYLNLALTRVGHFARAEPGPEPLQPTLATEIEARRPVATKIDWSEGGGHFPVITGYTDFVVGEPPVREKYLAIQDPAYGQSFVPYDSFRTAYQGSGTWTYTFFTR